VNALASPEVGKYVNENFVSAFQKVATFRIVNGQKQGGNVATYFCAPDGRVLHVIPGPVNSAVFLREAKWVVDNAHKALEESQKTKRPFKVIFRELHAAKLKKDYGIVVEPIAFDVDASAQGQLSYRDPTGQPLAPILKPAPVEGPDVTLGAAEFRARQAKEAAEPNARVVMDKGGRRVVAGNQAQGHILLAAHCMHPIETVYGTVFENILGEKITTKPVEIVTPFPWRNEGRGGVPLDLKKKLQGLERE
jgi:hypothetical protein